MPLGVLLARRVGLVPVTPAFEWSDDLFFVRFGLDEQAAMENAKEKARITRNACMGAILGTAVKHRH
ncbi:hypothetical protein GCM10009827_090390 [Dactylosporangium maewongense]|uniref:Uncharacterized protein n=1 Tax=Dactylosporangium maewongense TaxID=634393 RepID=A0ABP4N7Z9_9ACTN